MRYFSPKPSLPAASGRRKEAEKITFDYEGDARIHGISAEQLALWKENFPALDVESELRKATVWLDANRRKRKYDLRRFLASWLTQAQDRAKIPPGPPRSTETLTEERRIWSDAERG